MSDYIEHACFYCGSLICREYCQEEKMMPEPPIDPPEDTTEAPYDVYLTVLVRVHAPNEAGARALNDLHKLWLKACNPK
jgi:hypothetical protein